MAMEAGTLLLKVEYAQGLKDKDLFGRQDPYVNVEVGASKLRGKTITDGGKNPVFNQEFTFTIMNENEVKITIMDADIGKDDVIGTCSISLAKVRQLFRDTVQAHVITKKGKPRGTLQVSVTFMPNRPLAAGGPTGYYAAPPHGYTPPPYGGAQLPYGAAPYTAAPPQYGGPPQQYGAPPQQYGVPPQQYSAPPQQYGVPPQQYSSPPQQYSAPPPQQYSAPSQQYSAPPPQQYSAPPQYNAPPPQYSAPPLQYSAPPAQYGHPHH